MRTKPFIVALTILPVLALVLMLTAPQWVPLLKDFAARESPPFSETEVQRLRPDDPQAQGILLGRSSDTSSPAAPSPQAETHPEAGTSSD